MTRTTNTVTRTPTTPPRSGVPTQPSTLSPLSPVCPPSVVEGVVTLGLPGEVSGGSTHFHRTCFLMHTHAVHIYDLLHSPEQ